MFQFIHQKMVMNYCVVYKIKLHVILPIYGVRKIKMTFQYIQAVIKGDKFIKKDDLMRIILEMSDDKDICKIPEQKEVLITLAHALVNSSKETSLI